MAVKPSNRRPRVLSGIQPSGTLHLGNYLGALRPWAARQEDKENYFCIADMHAINDVQNPETLRRLTHCDYRVAAPDSGTLCSLDG